MLVPLGPARADLRAPEAEQCCGERVARQPQELGDVSRELDELYRPGAAREGTSGYVQDVYARKFTADYAAEMNRSVAWWLERWSSGADGE